MFVKCCKYFVLNESIFKAKPVKADHVRPVWLALPRVKFHPVPHEWVTG